MITKNNFLFEQKCDIDSIKVYLNICNKYVSFDMDKAILLTKNAIKYYSGNVDIREELSVLHEIENKWYISLINNNPDYSVYDDVYFLCDVYACWVVYSRNYIKRINSEKSLITKSIVQDMCNIKTVVDLGCGFGFTTASLKQLFPTADVYGTNIKNTCQYKVASHFALQYDFKMVEDIYEIQSNIDLIFASEYFEHIYDAIENIIKIIHNKNPKYMIIANAFNTKAVGHFDSYVCDDIIYNAKKYNLMFNEVLSNLGYEKMKTKCWNGRPAYYKKRNLI